MAEEAVGQATEGDKKIVHTYPLVKVRQKQRNIAKMELKFINNIHPN